MLRAARLGHLSPHLATHPKIISLMEDEMQQWWLASVPFAMGAVGYLARRWIEQRRRGEGLKRKRQALALFQGMKRAGLSLDDLDEIERDASR